MSCIGNWVPNSRLGGFHWAEGHIKVVVLPTSLCGACPKTIFVSQLDLGILKNVHCLETALGGIGPLYLILGLFSASQFSHLQIVTITSLLGVFVK